MRQASTEWGMNRALFYLISIFFTMLGLVPRNAAVRWSRGLAGLWFAIDGRHRRVAINNLTYVFGCEKSPIEIRRMARRVFANIVMVLFEVGWLYRSRPGSLAVKIRFEGLPHLQQAIQKGRGVLVLTGHLGNWELLANAAGLLGYPVNVVYRPLDFEPLDLFFRRLRGRQGADLLPKAQAMRGILRKLGRKELVGILLDQNAGRHAGVFVDFFGRPACTNKGLALVARRLKAPVVPIFLVREDSAYRMIVQPEVPLILTGDKDRDVEANTRRYNQVLESMIRRYPEQWFWVHRRWKTRPRGQTPEGEVTAASMAAGPIGG